MGVIIVNGIEYSGAGIGGGNIIYLTQEEYDALPETKESDNIEYRITNANSHINASKDWFYDNTESGLESDNVQDAIDEVNGNVSTLSESLENMFVFIQDKVSPITKGQERVEITIPTIEGYTPVALTNIRFSAGASVDSWSIAHSLNKFIVYVSGVQVDQNIVVGALYVKESCLSIVSL